MRDLPCEVICQLDSRLLRLEHFLPVAKFLHAEGQKQEHYGLVLVMGLAMAPVVAEFITTCFPCFRLPVVICGSNKRVVEADSDGPAVIEAAIRCVHENSREISLSFRLFLSTPAGITEFEPQTTTTSVPAHPELGFEDGPCYSFKPA